MRQNINKLKKNNLIIGYGAPAKATTILNYFGLSDSHLKFTIDDNKLKQNKFIPGTNIQIRSLNSVNPLDYE